MTAEGSCRRVFMPSQHAKSLENRMSYRLSVNAAINFFTNWLAEIEVIGKKDRPALGGGIVTFRHDVRNAVGNRVIIYEILRFIADDRHADALGAF